MDNQWLEKWQTHSKKRKIKNDNAYIFIPSQDDQDINNKLPDNKKRFLKQLKYLKRLKEFEEQKLERDLKNNFNKLKEEYISEFKTENKKRLKILHNVSILLEQVAQLEQQLHNTPLEQFQIVRITVIYLYLIKKKYINSNINVQLPKYIIEMIANFMFVDVFSQFSNEMLFYCHNVDSINCVMKKFSTGVDEIINDRIKAIEKKNDDDHSSLLVFKK